MKSRRESLPDGVNGGDAARKLTTDVVHEKVNLEKETKMNSAHQSEQQPQRKPRVPIGNIADFDADNDGFIDPHEAVKLARSLGLNSALPVDTLKKGSLMIDNIDTDRDSKISPSEWQAGYATLA